MEVKPLQPEKQDSPNEVTEEGMEIEIKRGCNLNCVKACS